MGIKIQRRYALASKILFFWLFSLTFSARAQYTIPDSGFINWLNTNGYSSCLTGNQLDTNCAALLNAKYINISYKNVNNLNGIQFFKGLDSLRCNADTVLQFIPSLPAHLKFFECRNNSITVLPPLPDSLTTLACESNPIATLPPLPGTLKYLTCYNNLLHSLPTLPSGILELYCSGNQIDSLPPLPDSLTIFSCFSNNLKALPALPVGLLQLACANNPLHTLPTLPPLLRNLDCNNDSLTALPSLPDSLSYLGCYHNQLTTIPALPTALTALNCEYNKLISLPDLPDSLNQLYCDNNPTLHCFPVLKTIWDFEFYNTGASCLPNYGNVYISNPSLTSLPICDSSNNTHGCTIISGISEIEEASVSLYPNPANQLINLVFTAPINNALEFELINNLGQTVLKQQLHQGQITAHYPTGNLNNGIYLFILKTNQRTLQTGKLIIMQ